MANYEHMNGLIRLIASLTLFIIGLSCFLIRPAPYSFTHGEENANKTFAISGLDESNGTSVTRVRYLPAGFDWSTTTAVFIGGLMTLALGGAYIIQKFLLILKSIENESNSFLEETKRLGALRPKDFIRHYGTEDTFMAAFSAFPIPIGIIVTICIALLGNWRSSKFPVELLDTSGVNLSDAVPAIGSLKEHGKYTLESWTCQLAPLLTGVPEQKDFRETCKSSILARWVLIAAFPFAVIMVLTVVRPSLFDFEDSWWTRRGGWSQIPLEEGGESSEDEDEAAATDRQVRYLFGE